jgi:hypothetical protein
MSAEAASGEDFDVRALIDGDPGPSAELGVDVVAPNGTAPSASEQPERLEVMTAEQVCALPDPTQSAELLGPAFVRGYRTVFGGATGHGKSTWALQAIKAIVTEGEFLGWRGAGGRALIIDAEQGLRSIKRRLREAGLQDCEEIDFLRVPDGMALDQDAEEIAGLEAILEAGDYAIVSADPLYKLHRGDSNDERQAVDLMRRLDAWRERFGFALLMTTHPRKRSPQGGKFTMDEFFGSGAYTRGAEIVLGLERVRPGYGRLHFFKDRDGDLPTGEVWGLLFDRDSGYRRDPEDGKATATAAEEVEALLEADPGMSSSALEEATGKSERTIRDALKKLGAISTGKPKVWTLPEQEELDV